MIMAIGLFLYNMGTGSKYRKSWIGGALVGSAAKSLNSGVTGVSRVHNSRIHMAYWMSTKHGIGYNITSRKAGTRALFLLHELIEVLKKD